MIRAAHRLLAVAGGYDLFQRLIGGGAGGQFARDLLQPGDGEAILDLGCGTGKLLAELPPATRYVGYDYNANYIAEARRRYPSRGVFHHRSIEDLRDAEPAGSFDLVVAKGVLHHLDDPTVAVLVEFAHRSLRPGGSLVTIDPVRHDHQHPVARWLAARDRGRHVRRPEQYRALVAVRLAVTDARVLTGRLRVPYSHFFMRAERRGQFAV